MSRLKSIRQMSQLRQRLSVLLFAVIFASLGTYYLTAGHAAGVGVLSVSPASSAVSLDSTLTMTITENSSTASVNAVEADLTYDQTKLQYVSTSVTTSPFTLVANNTGGNGAISIASATSTPLTGSQVVAVVSFKAIGQGSAVVGFSSSSGLAQASDNTNILGTSTGATYTIADTTPPSVPTGLAASNQTATAVTLSWAAATDNVGVTGYRIYRGGVLVGTAASTSYTNTGLAPSNTYNYTVAAYDAAGNTSAQSTALAATTLADTTPPTVPVGLTVGTRTLTSVALSWTASTDNVGVTGYKIYLGAGQMGTATGTSYTASGLTPGTTYSFTVAAYDGSSNTSAQSVAVSTSTLADTTPPTVPSGLTSTAQTTTSVSLQWAASTDNVGVAGYKLYRGGVLVATVNGVSYTDAALTSSTAYSYALAAFDAAGNTSAQSAPLSVTTATVVGDANGDGHVNYLDLSILAATWQSTTDLRADFNHDGVVNFLDLSILASKWGT